MASADTLPVYAPMLAAYHQAFENELRAMIAGLPISAGGRVLDLACGDGAYSRWLAERTGPRGTVLAVDISWAYLGAAHGALSDRPSKDRILLAAATVDRLPFADDTFDLVWCAQSLYSLPDPVDALARIRRILRPGGVAAVLENDSLHHVLLPWPVEIELAVRRAELRAFVEESSKPRKFYIARQLRGTFRAAGFDDGDARTFATDRQAPLGSAERAFLEHYLADLRGRAMPHLDPAIRKQFEELADPNSAQFLLDRPDLSVTCLDHVVWGIKPIKRADEVPASRAAR